MPKLAELQSSQNIVELLEPEKVREIGYNVVQDYEVDDQSRSGWKKKMKAANELALQVAEEKSFPWNSASNVKFPLVTIAALQFASRAYPNLVKAPNLVKMRKQGQDPQGLKSARANRVSQHMSWQMLEQDEQWEEDQDKAFLALPILGCIFKKSYYDPAKGFNCSKLVLPKNLCVHYYAKSLEECDRKTEVFELYDREIRERQLRGVYIEVDLFNPPMTEGNDSDKREGKEQPVSDRSRPRTILEQHCYLDLDGDGYPEPYVVTVDKETRTPLRIFHRFKKVISEQSVQIERIKGQILELAQSMAPPGQEDPQQLQNAQRIARTVEELQGQVEELQQQEPKVLRIEATEYFTKYSFIPSTDGGFYDIGF